RADLPPPRSELFMDKHLFNLKLAAKDLERNAKQCDRSEAAERVKLRNAMLKGSMDAAQIHAENAIRQRNQALSYRRMGARIDAVTGSMSGVVKGMEAAMRSMNLEQMSKLMEKFEREFEHLDVQSRVMDDTMANASTLSTPQAEVDSLIQQSADEAGIELRQQLPDSGKAAPVGTSTVSSEQVF
uniref:Charged multivesicular body protein 1b n=1 Tax=Macrostomum lignano TaxID=282301 RepID=A0A1I8II39_9PLAT